MGQCFSTPASKYDSSQAENILPQQPLPPSSQQGRWVWVSEDAPPSSPPQPITRPPPEQGPAETAVPAPEMIQSDAQTPADLSNVITEQDLMSIARAGSGGFADVFRLNHAVLGVIALKEIREFGDEGSLERARRHGRQEAATWNRLHHPNILPLLGIYESPSRFCLVSPFCVNGNISGFVRVNPRADRLTLLVEAAEGIDHIHRAGYVHGGVKGANILISDTFHALIIDFGESRLQQDATLTSLHGVGSYRWTSPELFVNGGKSPASDIWAFGMTMYEVLSGNIPFHTVPSVMDVVTALLDHQARPEPAPRESATGESYSAAWEFASSCWSWEPSARPSLGLARARFSPASLTHFYLEVRRSVSSVGAASTERVAFHRDELSNARKIGAGGFGEVFLVVKSELGQIAMKRLREVGDEDVLRESRRRASREAKLWLELDHPNLLPLIGHLETRESFYFVSPYMRNGALPGFLGRNPMIDRMNLIAEAAAGVAYLHERGIIHGDIKAGNVLVDDEKHARVHDFSLSRLAESQTSVAGQGNGTLRWQSPELIKQGHGKTTKSDVWAFGMFIYEVLSGEIPFKGMTDFAVMRAMDQGFITPKTEPETSPAGVSYAAVWAIATQCWRENPAERPSMKEIHDQLIAILS